jgi:hypothetical protein
MIWTLQMGYLDPELDMEIPSCTWSQYPWLWTYVLPEMVPVCSGVSWSSGIPPKGVPNRVILGVPDPQIHRSEGSEDPKLAI